MSKQLLQVENKRYENEWFITYKIQYENQK